VPRSGRSVTVDEAARYLGLTVDAVRKRVQRGQIAHEKDAAGRVRIILDESETLQDDSPDTTGPATHDPLVERLREEVAYLRGVIATRTEELARRDEEIRRRDEALEREQRLAAFFAERIRELEAPASEAEASESRDETPERSVHAAQVAQAGPGGRREEDERERDELGRRHEAAQEVGGSARMVLERGDEVESRPREGSTEPREQAGRPYWWLIAFLVLMLAVALAVVAFFAVRQVLLA
jgi:excisionase family DNA binding protein